MSISSGPGQDVHTGAITVAGVNAQVSKPPLGQRRLAKNRVPHARRVFLSHDAVAERK